MNLLIPYVHLYEHPDPLFEEFTYADEQRRGRKLRNRLSRGDYVFFHTSINGNKCITAYYVVDRVMATSEAAKDRNIAAKYKNPHIGRFLDGNGQKDDHILFGDPITSRVLDRPLIFNKALAERLSLNIKFPKERTETQAIVSATRAWRELTDEDVQVLFTSIEYSSDQPSDVVALLSTDEVSDFIEKDIEAFIERNPRILGQQLKLMHRQFDTPVGRIDLLFEDSKGTPVVVELKLNKIGRSAVNQVRRYMNWVKKETKKSVRGIIVCKGVMPSFEDEFKSLKNIKVFCYGWQLKVALWQ